MFRGMAPDEQLATGEAYLAADDDIDDATHYVVDDAIVSRPVFPDPDVTDVLADGVAKVTFSGLPVCQARITGDAESDFAVTESTLELTFDAPGEYRVELTGFPYRTKQVTIHAN